MSTTARVPDVLGGSPSARNLMTRNASSFSVESVNIRPSASALSDNNARLRHNLSGLSDNPSVGVSKEVSFLEVAAGKLPNKKMRKFEKMQRNNSTLSTILADKSNVDISDGFVSNISRNLSFAVDVVEERSPHTLPYTGTDLLIMDKSTTQLPKLKKKGKRVRVPPRRPQHQPHVPCHLISTISEVPVNPEMKKSSEFLLGVYTSTDELIQSQLSARTGEGMGEEEAPVARKASHTWEEHVLALLSQQTSGSIIDQFTPGNKKEQLRNFLAKRRNPEAKPVSDEQIDDDDEEQFAKPVDEDKPTEEPPPPSVPIKTFRGNVPDSKVSYEKVEQEEFPNSPRTWTRATDRNGGSKSISPTRQLESRKSTKGESRAKVMKGMKKWTEYPKPVSEEELVLKALSQQTDLIPQKRSEKKLSERTTLKLELIQAVDEWKSKWLLERCWDEKSLEEISTALKDINDSVRLAAASAACKVISNNRYKTMELINKESDEYTQLLELEKETIETMKGLLKDESYFVSFAASISLFVIDRGTQEATDLLLESLTSGSESERWCAVQCLAVYEYHTDAVVRELLKHVNNTKDTVKHARAAQLLTYLSKFTDSVQYMLAEQLNSSGWKDRMICCQILPILSGRISRDIANKLSHLMWHDWCKDVRQAAAKTLGQTGNGKLVHDSLVERLKNGNELVKIDALRKIGLLGIVTPRLLPFFSNCLHDEHLSVRLEALKCVSLVQLSDKRVLKSLVHLLEQDRSWKIKARAIQALSQVASDNPEIRQVLLWAMQYELEAAVRIEACAALMKLGFHDQEFIEILQERLLVEQDHSVLGQMMATLNSLGVKPMLDTSPMIEDVRERVRELCKKNRVVTHILEIDDEMHYLEACKNFGITYGDEPSEQTSDAESDISSLSFHLKELEIAEKEEPSSRKPSQAKPSSESRPTSQARTRLDSQTRTESRLRSNSESRPESRADSRAESRGFDPVLAAYRIRESNKMKDIKIPDMRDPYIPYADSLETTASSLW